MTLLSYYFNFILVIVFYSFFSVWPQYSGSYLVSFTFYTWTVWNLRFQSFNKQSADHETKKNNNNFFLLLL